jgi:hypothetical protein
VLTVVLVAFIIDNVRTTLRIGTIAVVVITMALLAGEPPRTSSRTDTITTFSDKILYSLQELRIADYSERADINRNWRGFESYRALQTFKSGSPARQLFGQGFGTNVDLGFTMTIAGEEFERIPVLHNGYMYLLVKTGVAGLVAYLFYLLLIFRTGAHLSRSHDPEARFCGFMLVTLALIILGCTLVISGMFNKSWVFPAILLLGLLMGYRKSLSTTEPDEQQSMVQPGQNDLSLVGSGKPS